MEHFGKILFLGHDAGRTGAPLLLLELIKWLNIHSSIKPSVLLKQGGELEESYRAAAAIRCYAEECDKMNRGLYRRVCRKLRLSSIRQPILPGIYPPEEYSVVYANTIDTCDLAMQLAGPGRCLVHHIHELAYTTEFFGATEMLRRAVPYTDVYIAVSQAVREFLENAIGVPPTKIQVIHEFPIYNGEPAHASRQDMRRSLGIPDTAFVIGMCGLPQWRKGVDLFVQLALQVKRQLGTAQCHFVWLGGDANSHREALLDVKQTGLQDTCHFVGAVPNPESYYSVFDLFALTSREDPFSVAMLEAAACGLPIVCFAGAGGAPELVEDDSGRVVPYLDVEAMAHACTELLLNASLRRQLGANAQAKVNERYSLALQGPKILAVIEAAMKNVGK